mmetsp:Transcript_1735/g.1831  ORF Transcript_1735/g.1831 Transcript_1735/m.1831 type:complete len:80 (-) Transcript_1735:118-357(-)|eukprot:CAMPEP_0176415662 /NCGR_PEP_ID=MMETSP0127-20121128/5928_1 /TAXON_ID=938130 /ORGANISM="Platyophrya macrostoma, Strain WH" /LENGTH=79 /DNA_ID=CAMNT_0017795677 /DNA_START=37 /DNA_END=276 /DNA_ORIENTATION=+
MSKVSQLEPATMLQQLVGEHVSVQSKWGPVYAGVLVSVDRYMNLQIKDCVEIANGTEGELGETLLRCNNVLYIRKAPVA